MKTLEFRPGSPDRRMVQADVEAKMRGLFARCPTLCGFAVQDRASLPEDVGGPIPDADLYVTEIGIYPKLDAEQYGDLYDEITIAISDLVQAQPDAYDLLRGTHLRAHAALTEQEGVGGGQERADALFSLARQLEYIARLSLGEAQLDPNQTLKTTTAKLASDTRKMSDFTLDLSLQVGKYDIQKLLGKGATGTVYLAKDQFTGKEVALKTIEPEVFRDPEFGTVYRSQFQNEASLAGKLRHPHIIGILDAVVTEDSGHIAMELVHGGDLSQFVRPDKLLPVADVLQIGFKCCGALDYAYREQGIVHRDIKPANIMVTKGTDIRIADFGAAFLKKSHVAQSAAMGSPFYMAPEQIEGRELTFHSDMYSLGVVLYELLVGRRPFIAENLEQLINKILTLPPLPPSRGAQGPAEGDRRGGAARHGEGAVAALRHLGAVQRRAVARRSAWCCRAGSIPDSEKYLALSKVEMLQLLERRGVLGAGGRRQVVAHGEGRASSSRRTRRAAASSSSPRARPR